MKRILITGVAGFIGSHVAHRFLAEGYDVVGIDDLSGGRLENVPAGVELVIADLADVGVVTRIPPGCRQILHLAGQSSGEISFDDPVADLQKNTVSSLNLIRYGIQQKSERFVYASSMSVYGRSPDAPVDEAQTPQPLSCYGVGKLATEGYLRVYQRQLPFVTLRMFNVYGPGQDLRNLRQGMVSIYLAQALTSGKIEVRGSLDRFRDFIFIEDVVEAWWRAATTTDAANQVLNVGTGQRTSVRELLEQLCQLAQATYFVQGATPGDQMGIYASTERLRSMLGLGRLTKLESGLPRFVDWARRSMAAS